MPSLGDWGRRGARRRRMATAALMLLTAPLVSACSTTVKSASNTTASNGTLVSRGRIDDPRTNKPNHVQCLQQHHLPVQLVGITGLQIGPPPSGATVVFESTPGVAQGMQIQGKAQGAEVIGSALLYPNQAPASELGPIETCLAQGVSG